MRTLIRSPKAWALAALAAGAGAALTLLSTYDSGEAACQGTCSASATVTLTAAVSANCSLSVVSNTSAALDLTQNTPSSGTSVAIVLEKCNAKSGYNISLASSNSGKLKGQSATPSEELPYTLKYDTVDVSFVNSAPVIALTNQPKTNGTGTERTIKIVYSGAVANLVEDIYSDTVTITLTAS